MNVRNCKRCRRLFNYITGNPICPSCKEALEEKFQEVKKYVQDNKNCSVQQVSEACDIEEAQIRQWVREERLEFGEGSVSGIACESCGAPLMSGRFCEKCKASMLSDLKSVGRRPEAPKSQPTRRPDSNKMRFLNQ